MSLSGKLLPEINNFIMKIYEDIEAKNVDISNLTFDDVFYLLISHRNKSLIRKLLYININEIMNNNLPISIIDNDQMNNLTKFIHLIIIN